MSNVYQTETLFTGLTEEDFTITKSVGYFNLIRIDYQTKFNFDLFDSVFISPPDDSFSTVMIRPVYMGSTNVYFLQIRLIFSNLSVAFEVGRRRQVVLPILATNGYSYDTFTEGVHFYIRKIVGYKYIT